MGAGGLLTLDVGRTGGPPPDPKDLLADELKDAGLIPKPRKRASLERGSPFHFLVQVFEMFVEPVNVNPKAALNADHPDEQADQSE